MQSTSSGGANGAKNSEENSVIPKIRLTLVELKSYKLAESDVTARHATHQQFLDFARSLVPLSAEGDANLEKWTVEERRDFLNWCLENDIVAVQGERLVPLQETLDRKGKAS